jgi:nucleotide-binding universal stress UspA family protein
MIRHILVPLDGSALAESALPHVQTFARLTGAGVTLAQVIEPLASLRDLADSWEFTNVYAGHQEAAERNADAYLGQVAQRLAAAGIPVDTRLVAGTPAEAIIQTGREFDLIIMATHGRGGLGRWVYGSVTDKVLRGATVPVLLVRARHDGPAAVEPPRRILVPLDGSPLAEQALPLASWLAQRAGATLILLQSIGWAKAAIADYPQFFAAGLGADRLLEQAEENARAYLVQVGRRLEAQGLTVQVETRLDPAAEAILSGALEAQADLIVMNTHGRGGLGRWVYGSVADRVMRQATLPVLLVRADRAGLPAGGRGAAGAGRAAPADAGRPAARRGRRPGAGHRVRSARHGPRRARRPGGSLAPVRASRRTHPSRSGMNSTTGSSRACFTAVAISPS